MLKILTIQGFKSIERQTIALGALNVLIGANGSGKSNLLGALSFFKASALGNQDALVKQSGGADRLLYHGKKTTKACFFACESEEFSYEQTLIPVAGDRLEVVGAEEQLQADPSAKRHIEGWRRYHLHDTSATAAVKATCNIDDNRYLREDASNLAAYLYWLKLKHPVEYRRVVSTIKLAAPYFEDFVLEPLRRNEQTIRFYGLPDNFPGVSAASTGYQGNKSAMERACQEANGPENINHGKETHPSKRLEGYGMGFRKTSAVAVLKDIGLDAIRAACPHFNAWLDHLEKLGAPA